MPIAAVVSLVLVLIGCVWAHVAAYRFFAARHTQTRLGRVVVGGFFATMFVGPLLLRALPRTEITGLISRIGTLWHLFVLLAALPYGVYAIGRWVQARRARAVGTSRQTPNEQAAGESVPAEERPEEPARRRALETPALLAFLQSL